MDSTLSYTQAKQREIIDLIQRLVECESPSDAPAAVKRVVDLVADAAAGMGGARIYPGGRFGPHLRIEFDLLGGGRRAARASKREQTGQVLALGHSDTVYPLGTLATMPFRASDGRLWGPGVLDMKAGIAFFLFAMRALRELDAPVSRKVVLLLNSDEEVGSESSRPLTEMEARASEAVLDRKSTRLNSSHQLISYAVFCLK